MKESPTHLEQARLTLEKDELLSSHLDGGEAEQLWRTRRHDLRSSCSAFPRITKRSCRRCFLQLISSEPRGFILFILLSSCPRAGHSIRKASSWRTFSSSGMSVSVGRMRGMRGLVAYPLGRFYVGFAIMGIFSSRGSVMLEEKVM